MHTNPYQRAAMANYEGGEFAQITSEFDVSHCGDSLFRFVMSELSDEEDCGSKDEAVRRINTAIRSLQTVLAGLEQLDERAGDVPLTDTFRSYYRRRLSREFGVELVRDCNGWMYTGSAPVRFANEDDALQAAVVAHEIGLPDWETVARAYGLDTSFQYGERRMLQYTEAYIQSEDAIERAMQ